MADQHDAQCESFFVEGPNVMHPCGCEDRRSDAVLVSSADLRVALSCFLNSNATVHSDNQGAIERLGDAAWGHPKLDIPGDCDTCNGWHAEGECPWPQ